MDSQYKMHPFRTIYIDMNSFFASVEQHEEPYLRGKPVGITAMEGDVGCLVAASYEAKYFGVKTTMSIKEARALCPKIILRPSRHRLYVNYNQRIARVFDQYAELEYVRSVDEFQIALGGTTSNLKRTWCPQSKNLDWSSKEEDFLEEFLYQSTQVKNIWIPYGE